MVKLGNDWDEILAGEFEKDYYKKLREFLKREYATQRIYPHMNDIFAALRLTAFKDVRVVILGQDPYHAPAQAHGLCFSVRPGIKPPPSLLNIYKEIEADVGQKCDKTCGFLESWAKSGVLLLNTVLTVREGAAGSHRGKGWEIFTDRIIELINERSEPVVFLLWGANAKSKASLINSPQHLILTAAHPSPLSAYNGFFGCKHFSKTNEFLGDDGIKWGT